MNRSIAATSASTLRLWNLSGKPRPRSRWSTSAMALYASRTKPLRSCAVSAMAAFGSCPSSRQMSRVRSTARRVDVPRPENSAWRTLERAALIGDFFLVEIGHTHRLARPEKTPRRNPLSAEQLPLVPDKLTDYREYARVPRDSLSVTLRYWRAPSVQRCQPE